MYKSNYIESFVIEHFNYVNMYDFEGQRLIYPF